MLADLQSESLSLDNAAIDVPAGWAEDVVNCAGDPQKLVVQMPTEERPKRTTAANPSASEWAYTVPMLRSTQKKLLDVLALHSDKWGVSWCSQKRLAFEVGCSDRRIRDHLKFLEGRKLIRRIGRVGKHGAQLTDVVILVGWPDRKLIPTSGHRTLKLAIQENEETRYLSSLLRAQAQTKFPGGAEKTSDQNKDNPNSTTTAQVEKALTACFEALGPWATAENMQDLSDDLKTLKGWLDKGIDLHLHILPVLAEKANNQAKIPPLRTWRYFEVPIGKAVNRKHSKTKNLQAKAKQVRTAPHSSEETTQEADVTAAVAAVPSPAEPMPAFQHQMLHLAKGEEQIQFIKAITAMTAGRKRRFGKAEV